MDFKEQLFSQFVKPILTPYKFCGHDCYIKHWSEQNRSEFSIATKANTQYEDSAFIRCASIVLSLADADGKLLFSMDDVPNLLAVPSPEIGAAFSTILNIQKDPDDKNTEEIKKNSTGTHT